LLTFRTATFAQGTPLVQTAGSQDVSCPGLFSSSGNQSSIVPEASQTQTQSPSQATGSHSQPQKKKHNVTIIAATVPIVSVLLIMAAIAIYLFNRRNNRAAKRFGGLVTQPYLAERGPLAVPQKHRQEDDTPSSSISPASVATYPSQQEIVIQHVDGHAAETHEIHVPPPYPATRERA
jgi:hypothetical protein